MTLSGGGDLDGGDSLYIVAGFNEEVNWEILIEGNTSGGSVFYSGTSDTINKVWYGKADKGENFFVDETITVTFSVKCQDPIVNNFNILANTFTSYGYLISDFDGGGQQETWGAFSSDVFEVRTSNPAPSGGGYQFIKHTLSSPAWYLTGAQSGPISPQPTLGTEDATNVYFNAYILGTDLPNSAMEVGFVHNGQGKVKSIPNNWNGWRMVSFPVSEAKNFSGPTVTDISGITNGLMQLGGNPEMASSAEAGIDFIILTVGAPFYEE